MDKRHYTLKKAKKAKHRYDLHADQMAVATLELKNPRASSGLLSVQGEEWFLEKSRVWKGEVHIRRRNLPDETAVFSHDLKYRGAITLNGVTYHWAPANARWTEWTWKTDRGQEVMRLRIKPHLWKTQGEIVSERNLTLSESHHLSLLGWFMILSYLQNVEVMGLMGALKLVGGKKSSKKK